jgi:hypothetical protein
LKTGERVILEGFQQVQPGMAVKPVPFESATNAPAADGSENSGAAQTH